MLVWQCEWDDVYHTWLPLHHHRPNYVLWKFSVRFYILFVPTDAGPKERRHDVNMLLRICITHITTYNMYAYIYMGNLPWLSLCCFSNPRNHRTNIEFHRWMELKASAGRYIIMKIIIVNYYYYYETKMSEPLQLQQLLSLLSWILLSCWCYSIIQLKQWI